MAEALGIPWAWNPVSKMFGCSNAYKAVSAPGMFDCAGVLETSKGLGDVLNSMLSREPDEESTYRYHLIDHPLRLW